MADIEAAGTMEQPKTLGEVFSEGADTVAGSESITGTIGDLGADVIASGGDSLLGTTAASDTVDAAAELSVADQAKAGLAGEAAEKAAEEGGGKFLSSLWDGWKGMDGATKGALVTTGGGMLQSYAESRAAEEAAEEEEEEEKERLARLNETGNFSKYASFSSEYAV